MLLVVPWRELSDNLCHKTQKVCQYRLLLGSVVLTGNSKKDLHLYVDVSVLCHSAISENMRLLVTYEYKSNCFVIYPIMFSFS